jgi:hypothetical protein
MTKRDPQCGTVAWLVWAVHTACGRCPACVAHAGRPGIRPGALGHGAANMPLHACQQTPCPPACSTRLARAPTSWTGRRSSLWPPPPQTRRRRPATPRQRHSRAGPPPPPATASQWGHSALGAQGLPRCTGGAPQRTTPASERPNTLVAWRGGMHACGRTANQPLTGCCCSIHGLKGPASSGTLACISMDNVVRLVRMLHLSPSYIVTSRHKPFSPFLAWELCPTDVHRTHRPFLPTSLRHNPLTFRTSSESVVPGQDQTSGPPRNGCAGAATNVVSMG